MLISSSRKPSQKTRSFCKNISNAFNFPYVNRGKMSIRDLFLKANSLNENSLMLIYENRGNPSKITFYNEDSEESLSLLISANIAKERINIDTKYLKMQCDFPELEILSNILDISLDKNITGNYIHIKNSNKNDNIAIVEFYNNKDSKIDLEIAIKKIIHWFGGIPIEKQYEDISTNDNVNDTNFIIEFVNSTIAIEFDTEKESNLVYDSVINEIRTSPEYRSTIDLSVNDNFINIIINSKDMTSFRASINSIIKWMMLSLEVINLTNKG